MREQQSLQKWPMPECPGDLSRRIFSRRSELRLSTSQVAERARMSRRYVEYLEKFPSQPGAETLRRLAAALQTTPAALLGAGQGTERAGSGRILQRLRSAECWKLLAPGGVGRVGLDTAGGPLVIPVNYALVLRTIVLRTGVGSTIAAHASEQTAFEVDYVDHALAQGWSVMVRGRAHPVLQPEERRNLIRATELHPWPRGDHELYIRIVPDRITGFRLVAS